MRIEDTDADAPRAYDVYSRIVALEVRVMKARDALVGALHDLDPDHPEVRLPSQVGEIVDDEALEKAIEAEFRLLNPHVRRALDPAES